MLAHIVNEVTNIDGLAIKVTRLDNPMMFSVTYAYKAPIVQVLSWINK
jgi:hypothetical protein